MVLKFIVLLFWYSALLTTSPLWEYTPPIMAAVLTNTISSLFFLSLLTPTVFSPMHLLH